MDAQQHPADQQLRVHACSRGNVGASPADRSYQTDDSERHDARDDPERSGSCHPSDNLVSRLAKLGELRDAGVLTDEEFQAAKARLLS